MKEFNSKEDKQGNLSETFVKSDLLKRGLLILNTDSTQTPSYDIAFADFEMKVEVKSDAKALETGNFFIEIWADKNTKKMGNALISESDIWCYCFVDRKNPFAKEPVKYFYIDFSLLKVWMKDEFKAKRLWYKEKIVSKGMYTELQASFLIPMRVMEAFIINPDNLEDYIIHKTVFGNVPDEFYLYRKESLAS